jgi:hypothetical protein
MIVSEAAECLLLHRQFFMKDLGVILLLQKKFKVLIREGQVGYCLRIGKR